MDILIKTSEGVHPGNVFAHGGCTWNNALAVRGSHPHDPSPYLYGSLLCWFHAHTLGNYPGDAGNIRTGHGVNRRNQVTCLLHITNKKEWVVFLAAQLNSVSINS